jgi:hypothetical protein
MLPSVAARRCAAEVDVRGGSRVSSRGTRRAALGVLHILAGAAVVLALTLAINAIYQALRKPSEFLFPASAALAKTPEQTWRAYAPLFQEYATAAITPDLLAALAQAEAAGNPVARTYWRWSWNSHPFKVYGPASSSVGMYQMTDGAFAEASKFCIRDHEVIERGGTGGALACRLGLNFRVLPRRAVELTAAYLDRHVAATLARQAGPASPLQKRHLAAVVHLCGARAADAYARLGYRFPESQRCGDQNPQAYLVKVDVYAKEFRRLAARE